MLMKYLDFGPPICPKANLPMEKEGAGVDGERALRHDTVSYRPGLPVVENAQGCQGLGCFTAHNAPPVPS